MYIGPWQEYKLAQVIKVKNDLYEGISDNQSFKHLITHDSLNLSNHSNVSTPSTLTFSSEPIQRAYPKFAIDRYCDQWRKVEHLMSAPNEVHRKPPLPKLQVRQRQGKSTQAKRVNRMRIVYGLNKPAEVDHKIQDYPKLSFADKLKSTVNEGDKMIPIKKEFREDEKKKVELNEVKVTEMNNKRSDEVKEVKPNLSMKNQELDETKHKELNDRAYKVYIKGADSEMQYEHKEELSGIEHGAECKGNSNIKLADDQSKFTCLASISELDLLEESINHEAVDGLLQWIENLPDEVSSTMKDYREPKSREQDFIM